MFNVKEKLLVNIKGVEYKVYFVDEMFNVCGLTDCGIKKIYISILEDKEEMFETLVHELIHAYLEECGLISYAKDEVLISWLEQHFFELYNQFEDIYVRSDLL